MCFIDSDDVNEPLEVPDDKPLTLKEKVENAVEVKQEIVEAKKQEEAKKAAAPPSAEPHDADDDPEKPVPVRSVLSKLKPSENRYSFANNREEL